MPAIETDFTEVVPAPVLWLLARATILGVHAVELCRLRVVNDTRRFLRVERQLTPRAADGGADYGGAEAVAVDAAFVARGIRCLVAWAAAPRPLLVLGVVKLP